MKIIESKLAPGIVMLSLRNPPENKFDGPLFMDPDRLSHILADPDLKGAVIAGSGRHFSSGADVGLLRSQLGRPKALAEQLQRGKALLDLISFAPVPVAAMIQGSCLGAGLELALSCHFRVASTNALLGFPECEWGLMPGLGGTINAPGVASPRAAVELILSGRMIGAEEALNLGLVDRIVPTGDLKEAVVTFMVNLTARRSPSLIRTIMASINNGRRLPREEALHKETDLFLRAARDTAAEDDV